MKKEAIKVTDIISAVVRIDNLSDNDRQYDMACNVNIVNNVAVSVTDGQMSNKDGTATMQFAMQNYNFQTNSYIESDDADAKRAEMLSIANEFINIAMGIKIGEV